MAKPTFLQSLLNKPTQSYAFPAPKKDYHSQKKDLMRLAKAAVTGTDSRPLVHEDNDPTSSKVAFTMPSRSPAGWSAGYSSANSENPAIPSDAQAQPVDVIHGVGVVQELHPYSRHDNSDSSLDSDTDSNSEEDIFYTPNSSPRGSLIGRQPHTVTSLVPFPTPPSRPAPLIREDSVDSMTSTTATTSAVDNFDSASVDDYSLFSLPTNSDSTRLTTPVTSDAGHYPKHNSGRTTSPIRNKLGFGLPEATQSDVTFNGHPAGPSLRRSTTITSRTKRSTSTHANTSSIDRKADDNWSKDVRWLVPPPVSAKPKSASLLSSPPKRRAIPDTVTSPNSVPVQTKPVSQRRSKSLIVKSPPLPEYQAAPEPYLQPQVHLPDTSQSHRRSKSTSPRKTKTVMGMTALVEVDEPLETNELHHTLMGRDRTRTHSLIHTPSKLHLTSQSSRSRLSSTSSIPQAVPEHNAPPRSQYTTSSRTVTLPSPLPIISSNTHVQNLPSSGTPGFTSLVLPRAAYPGPSKPKASSKLGFSFGVLGGGEVDLTKDGMAQTTMATVEVVRGIAEASSSGLASNSATKAARRKTLSRSFGMPTFFRGSGSGKGKEKAVDESPLAFTSWRKPPGYVSANGVLVQVWAVGVDTVDQMIVKGAAPSSLPFDPTSSTNSGIKKSLRKKENELTKKADVGFIPGRSFVGRVLECGWEVGEDVIKKNDWVVGLSDVKRCGAMAEFIVEDRRRLHRVPYPRMPTNSANPDESAHALALEELALLPLAGVPAHRAVRTFTSVEAEANSAPKALVLSGHDGAGAMAVQMLAKRGWRVSVHVPVPTRIPIIQNVSRLYVEEDSQRMQYLQETEKVIRSWGAEEVLFVRQHDDDVDGRGGAIELMRRLVEAEEEFDGVLDTIGGKEVWDAGEVLLSCRMGGGEAQFTTLVGDAPERVVPSASDLFKSGVRSTKAHGTGSSAGMRRHSIDTINDSRKSKAKGKVGYAWVIINQDVDWQGEDIADSLRTVIREAAMQRGVRPLVRGDKIVPFEKTPEVFIGGVLGSGGTAVVKVVG